MGNTCCKPSIPDSAAVNKDYKVGQKIGAGAFSTVYKATLKETGEEHALKVIPQAIFNKNRESTLREVKILENVTRKNAPHIVRMYGTYPDKHSYTIAMELLKGQELYERICQKEFYSEESAKQIVKQMLLALDFLHANNIAHRDLKPENVIFADMSENSDIKLTDFGFANFYSERNKFVATCGTPLYVAPEILNRTAYDYQCDMWSLGVMTYILLCGFPPFYGDDDEQLYRCIKTAYYEFISPNWDPISTIAKDFIKRCFHLQPHKRMTAKDALQHQWIKSTEVQEQSNKHMSVVQNNMRRTLYRRKFVKGVNAVIAMQRLSRITGIEMKRLIIEVR